MPPQMVHAFVNFWRGWATLVRGDVDVARQMFECGVELGRTLSHRTIFGHTSTMLGRVELAVGNRHEAFTRFTDAMRMHLDIGDGWGLQLDLEGLATLAVLRGRTSKRCVSWGASTTFAIASRSRCRRRTRVARERLTAAVKARARRRVRSHLR